MTADAIVIDYGHGVDTPGKRYRFTDHNNFECFEYLTNRITAALLIEKLVRAGYEVYDCVAKKQWRLQDMDAAWSWGRLEQRDVTLNARTFYANTIPNSIVLSLHSNAVGYKNAGPSLSPRGGGFFTSPGETASDEIAELLYEAFVEAFEDEPVSMMKGQLADGDHDYEARFTMLTKTKMPAVLGEMLFFVNIDDARYLMSRHGQEVIADAYFEGITPFLSKRRL